MKSNLGSVSTRKQKKFPQKHKKSLTLLSFLFLFLRIKELSETFKYFLLCMKGESIFELKPVILEPIK